MAVGKGKGITKENFGDSRLQREEGLRGGRKGKKVIWWGWGQRSSEQVPKRNPGQAGTGCIRRPKNKEGPTKGDRG